jgi:hypothetical protein
MQAFWVMIDDAERSVLSTHGAIDTHDVHSDINA